MYCDKIWICVKVLKAQFTPPPPPLELWHYWTQHGPRLQKSKGGRCRGANTLRFQWPCAILPRQPSQHLLSSRPYHAWRRGGGGAMLPKVTRRLMPLSFLPSSNKPFNASKINIWWTAWAKTPPKVAWLKALGSTWSHPASPCPRCETCKLGWRSWGRS